MITLPRLPWHWRLRRWLGFDSLRRGILFIPNELHFREPDASDTDRFLNELIRVMTEPIRVMTEPIGGRPSRWWRFRRWAGFDSVRHTKSTRDARTLVPIILRGPASAAP
jgi:hypothetical protein